MDALDDRQFEATINFVIFICESFPRMILNSIPDDSAMTSSLVFNHEDIVILVIRI